METLELQGAKLRYHKLGKGPIIIFIPGANGTGDIFMPLAQQLKDKFTVVAVDRRGYGQSELTEPLPEEAINPDSRYRVKRDAKDITELAKSLSDEPVYVLGSSSGSIVAMHVLKEYPEVVKKLLSTNHLLIHFYLMQNIGKIKMLKSLILPLTKVCLKL